MMARKARFNLRHCKIIGTLVTMTRQRVTATITLTFVVGAAQILLAPASRAYQVSGPVLEVTGTKIVVEKNEERWEIERNKSTQGTTNIQKGDRVTIQYKLIANEVKINSDRTSSSRTATSSGTATNWVKVGHGLNEGGTDYYADPSTIRRSGNMAKMWSMLDHNTRQISNSRPYFSAKLLQEYDCKSERIRELFFTKHSGQMGAGNIVHTDDGIPSNWIPTPPGSVGDGLWKIACGTK